MLYCTLFNSNCIALDTAQCTALFTILRRGDNRSVTELIFAHISTKIWAYSVVFDFFRKKIWQKTVPQNHFLKIQWEMIFFTFFIWTKSLKKFKKKILLYRALSENSFWIKFWTLGSAPTGKCMKVKVCVFVSFLVGALHEVKNWIWKQFSDKVLYICNSKKNWKRFGPH